MSKQKAAPEVSTVPLNDGRIMRTKQLIHIDHFKLKVATKTVNMAPEGSRSIDMDGPVDLVKQEHCHFYHTYDSNGKKQTKCSFIAGHTHEITETSQGPGKPPLIKVGPAVKEVRSRDKRTKEWKVTLAPADADAETLAQCHTHEAEYLFSEQVETRDMNREAITLQAYEANKAAPVPGVIG